MSKVHEDIPGIFEGRTQAQRLVETVVHPTRGLRVRWHRW